MIAKRTLYVILILGLLAGFTQRIPAVSASPAGNSPALPGSDGEIQTSGETSLPEGVSGDWWAQTQAYIEQSEYEITWQEGTYLPDLPAAYQAPNRAHGLRTYFTPQGIRVIPREEEVPSWQLGISLLDYGSAQELLVAGNRIDYRRDALGEWYLNDEHGLQHNLIISPTVSVEMGNVLELRISGDLIPELSADGSGVEFSTADGRILLRYGELQISDFAGQVYPLELELLSEYPTADFPGNTLRITFPAPEAALTLTARLTSLANLANAPDGLPSTDNWSAEGNQGNAWFGWSVSTAGDVNGDGYGDVVVGAPFFDYGQVDEGLAFAYHGGPDGLSPTYDWMAESDQASAIFGEAVNTAGDVNGDGYDDVIIGASVYDNAQADEGRAYVYHGGPSGLNTTANWKAESDQVSANFGFSVGTAGDINGDGYSDVIIGGPYYEADDRGKIWVWYGSGDGLGADGTDNNTDWWAEGEGGGHYFGWSVDSAGDMDGDGFSDIIVGAYRYMNGEPSEGAAYIWRGGQGEDDNLGDPDRNPDWKVESNQANTELGRSVSTAGDVNGDGYSDIIVGAPYYENGLLDEGAVLIWYGSTIFFEDPDDTMGDADWRVEGEQASALVGFSVSTAGDVNGDGFSDVIVGAPLFDSGQGDEGAAFVWFGSKEGLGAAHRSADWSAESNQTSAWFGYSTTAAGDVNGDGCSDVIVGAHYYDRGEGDEGASFVYHGSPGDPWLRLAWAVEGNQGYAHLGWSVSTAGDVNGDGYGDVIVGAPHYDFNGNDSGKVWLWYGGPDGLVDPSILTWEVMGEHGDDRLGYSVAGAGDVNGDGYGDIIVGAPGYDIGAEYDHGKVYLWYGAPGGLGAPYDPATPLWSTVGERAFDLFGWSVSTAGDVNSDGYSDIIVGAPGFDVAQPDYGKVYVWYGAGGGLGDPADPETPLWWAEGEGSGHFFGWSVSTAGDVNGDSFGDIIVGAYYFTSSQLHEGAAYIWHGGHGEDDDLGEPGRIPDWRAVSGKYGTDFGTSVSTAGDVNGDGYSDVIVGAPYYDNSPNDEGAVFVWYGSAGGIGPTDDDIISADWMVEGEQGLGLLGFSVCTAGDVNADGYADIVIGMRYLARGQGYEGAAFVWYGSVDGPGPKLDTLNSTDWLAESNRADTDFGYAVSVAGDVNADGYSDVIVGAPNLNNPDVDEGGAYLYLGSGQGLSGTAWAALEGDRGGAKLGYSLDSAGDINADSYADIIVAAPYYDSGDAGEGRVYVFQGSATGLVTSTAWIADGDQLEAFFGWSVGTAGDVNGDGYSDIIAGTPYFDQGQVNEGAAFVWHGSSQGLGPSGNPKNAPWFVEGNQLSANFGWAVATAGDVNGDGFSEVIIGAPGYDGDQANAGRVYLYYGSADGLGSNPDWTDEGDQVKAGLGNAAGTAGDINGDGYTDVVVAADQYDNGQVDEGRAYAYYGSQGGLSPDPDWMGESDQATARFGCAVNSAGDVNGDGYADAIIGACLYDHHPLKMNEGAAFVWYGSAGGFGADGTPGNAGWMAAGDQKNAQFGFSVDTAGDVDGDGFADIIIGAPYYDIGPENDGRVFVYHGSQAGLSPTARWSAESGNIGGAQFGYAVSAAGDVNGDGYSDVIVGAPFYDHTDPVNPTVPDVGLVSLYTGNGADSLDLRPRQLQPDGSPLAHLGISDSETEIQLSLLGRSPLGRDLVRMQWQIAPLGTPFSDASVISGSTANWADTGLTGSVMAHTLMDLQPETPYHWRVRLIYSPGSRLGMPTSRWIHIPWDGWQEQDFRTRSEQSLIFLPIINR